MGMNGGIHDAINLADKLADVWFGRAGTAILDRYTRQRRKALARPARLFNAGHGLTNDDVITARDWLDRVSEGS